MNAPVIHPNPAMYISPEMIAELALGMDPPLDIAARYGFGLGEFNSLQNQPWFHEMVTRKRVELEADGQTFKAKGRMMLEELLQRLYQSAITAGLPANLTLELTKQLADVTGVKVAAAAPQGPAGPAFQININVDPGSAQKPGPRHIEGSATVVAPVTITIPKDDLPPKPEGFRVPDFKLTPDLVGNSMAVAAANSQPVGARL